MEYISAEEFLKQPKEAQKVFEKWWQPSVGDLFFFNNIVREDDVHQIFDINTNVEFTYVIYDCGTIREVFVKDKVGVMPLLNEGQLRQFIEDNGFKILDISRGKYTDKWYIKISKNDEFDIKNFEGFEDLLQAYWHVACEITKEEV